MAGQETKRTAAGGVHDSIDERLEGPRDRRRDTGQQNGWTDGMKDGHERLMMVAEGEQAAGGWMTRHEEAARRND